MSGPRSRHLEERPFQLPVEGTTVSVSALPQGIHAARSLFVMAHGAGAGMHHPFMVAMAERLASVGVGTLRFQFPYMEQRRRRPDPAHLLQATVRALVAAALERWPELPLFAGGKSMGGRMTSQAQAEEAMPGVRGLVFIGFPLHPAASPGARRADHLERVDVPMLFLQGDRDALARLDHLEPVCRRLGDRATLHIVEGADHSFRVRKRSGRTEREVMDELARAIASWNQHLPKG